MADMQIVVATAETEKKVEAQYVEMKVPLYSHGCEKKIKKALSHFKGIYSIEVNFNEQKVTVWGICNKYDVLYTIRNKRREALFWNEEDNSFLVLQKESNIANEQAPSSSSSFTTSSSSLCKKARKLVPPLTLIRCHSSLTWKSLKKVFIRSYSF